MIKFITPKRNFYPAVELNSASIILIHNHPTGDPTPSEKDSAIIERIVQAGEIMGISVIDFIITARNGNYSFYETLKGAMKSLIMLLKAQGTLFNLLEIKTNL